MEDAEKKPEIKEGDDVAYTEKPCPTGKVVGIIKKNWRQ